ncbi:MAG: hypothetical protein DRO95_02040 [Candidatus Altiarchaeales archaeon]|nr:MAG: hypothetical protein DRO95_02040 [Candidatus Altiarchaeales archaeon]
MKGRLWIGGLILVFGILVNSASAQLGGDLAVNDSDYALINVNVTTKTMVDVEPHSLTWIVEPGGVGDNSSEQEGPNYFAIQIENIGSHNITHVWLNATYPTDSPFAVGSAANTDAGNYVVISNDTSTNNPPASGFYFINRAEYNETRELVYLRDPAGNMPPDSSTYTYGRFRNNSREYFWFINAVAPRCNDSTYIRIGNEAHTRTSTGTTNFQTGGPGNWTEFSLTHYTCNGINWAVGNITSGPLASGTLGGYAVAVTNISDRCVVFFSKWNRDCPFDFPGTNAVYANEVAGRTPLVPGDSFALAIKVYVPYGIYEGPSNQGRIYIIVNDV